MILQVNTAGAWKNVAGFDSARKGEVVAAVNNLSGILGPRVKWCVVHDNGDREWLRTSIADAFREERARAG